MMLANSPPTQSPTVPDYVPTDNQDPFPLSQTPNVANQTSIPPIEDSYSLLPQLPTRVRTPSPAPSDELVDYSETVDPSPPTISATIDQNVNRRPNRATPHPIGPGLHQKTPKTTTFG